MANETNQQGKARIEMAKLHVPHENGEIVFSSYPYGPEYVSLVGRDLLDNGLKLPTGDHIASLLHSAYCDPHVKDEPEFKGVRDLMTSSFLWAFNADLWVDKGVYVIQDLDGFGKSKTNIKDLNELEKILLKSKKFNGVKFSEDGRVRFAPKETYCMDCRQPESLLNDGFVIASYGIDGVKKLVEICSRNGLTPVIHRFGSDPDEEPFLAPSFIGQHNRELVIDSHIIERFYQGFAFGLH